MVGTTDYDVFGGYRNQSGVTSRFGFTGEYFAQETGPWRDLNPSLGRFLRADSVQPNAPGMQTYNLYAYVANNPSCPTPPRLCASWPMWDWDSSGWTPSPTWPTWSPAATR